MVLAMDKIGVFVGGSSMTFDQAYNLCSGKLVCQNGAKEVPKLIDFANDYGLIGPALFMHRLVADSRSTSSVVRTLTGLQVCLTNKRVS